MKTSSLFLAGIFLLSACDQLDMKSPNTSGGDDTPVTRVRSSELNDNIKVSITGADAEKYTVQFSWPYFEQGKILRIRLGGVLAEVKSNQTFFTHTVAHNQTLTYSFDILDSNRRPEGTIRKTIVVPYDYVVRPQNSSLSAQTKIQAERVFLSDEAPLTTNGQTLDIITNEFHAEKGFIQTLPATVRAKVVRNGLESEEDIWPFAADLTPGRSGGNISINSRKLFGRLKIYMRGEKGGKGSKGSPKLGRAASGSPAGEGKWGCQNECRQNTCFVESLTTVMSRVCACSENGPSGGRGNTGERGNPGGQGLPGGDTGNVRVNIQEYIPSEGIDPSLPTDGGGVVQVVQQPGPGGIGGTGGEGQLGGLGGSPKSGLRCPGPTGEEGQPGPQGPDGSEGLTGKNGMKCVYVGSENINECSQ